MDRRVLQIIPAVGWTSSDQAESTRHGRDGATVTYSHDPLVCFALTETRYADDDELFQEMMGVVRSWNASVEYVDLTECMLMAGLECGGDCENGHFVTVPVRERRSAPDEPSGGAG